MKELFDFRLEYIDIEGFTMKQVLNALDNKGGDATCISSKSIVILTDKYNKAKTLKCIHKYIFDKRSNKKTCRECRMELKIDLKQRDCKKCFKQAIENYYRREYC